MKTKYAVINKENQISVSFFDSKTDAEKKAQEMTEYHDIIFVVKEVVVAEDGHPCTW